LREVRILEDENFVLKEKREYEKEKEEGVTYEGYRQKGVTYDGIL
jgi:hypothetical protein